MSVIVGVSMPRCGHHFIENLLRAAYDGVYDYCEFYGEKECCKAVPCRKNASLIGDTTRVFYQKNHDVDMTLPRKIDCDMALVQYRSPLDQSIANFDNYVRIVSHDDSAQSLPYFLATNAWHYIRFFQKWIQGSPDDIFLLKYEDLTDRPTEVIREIAKGISTPISDESLEKRLPVITATDPYGYPFVRRDYAKHRFFDQDIFAATERIMFENCGGLDYVPRFAQMPHEHALTLMRLLLASEIKRANPIERVRLLRRALEIRPDMGNVFSELALCLLAINEKDEAVQASEQAIALDAQHPAYLHVRGNVAFAMGDYRSAERYQKSAIVSGGERRPYVSMLERARQLQKG